MMQWDYANDATAFITCIIKIDAQSFGVGLLCNYYRKGHMGLSMSPGTRTNIAHHVTFHIQNIRGNFGSCLQYSHATWTILIMHLKCCLVTFKSKDTKETVWCVYFMLGVFLTEGHIFFFVLLFKYLPTLRSEAQVEQVQITSQIYTPFFILTFLMVAYNWFAGLCP
ncbi:hypothetical protein ACJX0J_040606 [Zea mays]